MDVSYCSTRVYNKQQHTQYTHHHIQQHHTPYTHNIQYLNTTSRTHNVHITSTNTHLFSKGCHLQPTVQMYAHAYHPHPHPLLLLVCCHLPGVGTAGERGPERGPERALPVPPSVSLVGCPTQQHHSQQVWVGYAIFPFPTYLQVPMWCVGVVWGGVVWVLCECCVWVSWYGVEVLMLMGWVCIDGVCTY